MESSAIHIGDWQRLLFGELPASFLAEVIIRTTIIFFLLILAMRIMGKRMAGQFGRNELAAMVSFAAAIGIPLQAPERGLLGALVVALAIIIASKAVNTLTIRFPKFEMLSQGYVSTLVSDAVIDIKAMKKARISRDRLYAQLRSEGIRQLGAVKRLYLEAGGDFSLVRAAAAPPGLSIIPDWDTDYLDAQQKDGNAPVCSNCGKRSRPPQDTCDNCGRSSFESALI